MFLCHECGEEIAQIDIYCPFCGISLQHVKPDEAVENSPANTIAPDQSETFEKPGKIGSGEITAASRAREEEIIKPVGNDNNPIDATEQVDKSVENIEYNTEDYSNSITEENVNFNMESVKAPADLIIGEISGGAEPVQQPEADIPDDSKELALDSEKDLDSEMEKAFENPVESAAPDELVGKQFSGLVEKSIGNIEAEPKKPAEFSQSEPETPESEAETTDPDKIITLEVDLKTDGGIRVSEGIESIPIEETQAPADKKTVDSLNDSKEDLNLDSIKEKSIEPIVSNKPDETVTEISAAQPETIQATASGEVPADEVDEIPEAEPSDRLISGGLPISFDVPVQESPVSLSDSFPSPEISDSTIEEIGDSVDVGKIIAKPDTELEMGESQSVGSQFDSVRIMESSEEAFEDNLAEPEINQTPPEMVANNEAVPEKLASVEAQPDMSEPVSAEEKKVSRSYTTPIVDISDTDGKKNKLKPLEEGTILNNRYEVVRKIGGGGMGAVYLASDKNLGGVLRAVKEMVQSYIEEAQQEKAVHDFKRESLLLTTLEHPAIPTIYDYFYDEKEARFYLVMKYINGGDLASRLRSAPEGRIDENTVSEWAIQLADVLDYLHKRQPPIVYRDLKPANIMIDGNTGRVMLIDFGIARWINKEEKGVTAVGTMGYAPPELFSGNVEPRSDIYSLGSTIFHLLTGADPQSNPLLIFDFQKNPRPRQINPQLSDQMERILMQTVEYNAEKRFISAAILRKELEEHLENLKSNRVTFGVKETPVSVTLSDELVFCGFCGQSIVASDLFCAFCGAKQPIGQKGVHGEKYISTLLTAKLMIIGINEQESPGFIIEKAENLIGRRDPMSNIFPEVDLSKFDPQTKISRRHARIWREGNNYMVEDLGSSNGTVLIPVVNEAFHLPPNNPHILTNGDKLKLGDTTLHFVLG